VSFGSWRLGDKVQADAIFAMLMKDTDRAAAIVAAIMLEDSLEKKLRATLRDSKVFGHLFESGRPLQFFGHRNDLAYLMNIYGKPFYQELVTISSIRNMFAHMYMEKKIEQPIKNFKSPAVRHLCDKLKLVEHLEQREEDRRDRLDLRTGRPPSWATQPLEALKKHPRMKYMHTCALCISALAGDQDREVIDIIWAEDLEKAPTSRS